VSLFHLTPARKAFRGSLNSKTRLWNWAFSTSINDYSITKTFIIHSAHRSKILSE